MAGLCFFVEDPDVDVYSDIYAWNNAVKMGGIDKVVMVDRTGSAQPFDHSLPTQIVTKLPELEGIVTFIVTPWDSEDSISLWDFDHKTDWYVIGPAHGWNRERTGVHIPMNSRGALHSVHAATVVMAHRFGVLENGSNLSR